MKRVNLFYIFATIIILSGPFLIATNGYFSHGYGAKSKGMAGAGTALSLSTLDSVRNPAAIVFLGNRIDIGVGFFMPQREYTVTGLPSMYPGTFPLTPGTVKSESTFFVMPHLGFNFMLGENTGLGVALYGNGGMNTNYNTSTFHGTSPTGVNLAQLFTDLTLSRKIGENHALGITLIVAYQMFKANGLESFAMFSRDPENLTNRGTDSSFGYGFRLGYLGKFSKYFAIGASYQSEIKMQSFDKYAGLFAEMGDFDIPAVFNIGIAFHPVQPLTVALDYQKMMYSNIKSVGNSFNPMDFYEGILLGDENGAGFAWEDMSVFKFGVQLDLNNRFALRSGFSTGEQPVSQVLFNILAPGVIETHFTLGGTMKLKGKRELTLYLMHAFPKRISGPNPMEAPGQQNIQLEMHQWELGFEFSF